MMRRDWALTFLRISQGCLLQVDVDRTISSYAWSSSPKAQTSEAVWEKHKVLLMAQRSRDSKLESYFPQMQIYKPKFVLKRTFRV